MRTLTQIATASVLSILTLMPQATLAANQWYSSVYGVSERTATMGAGSGHSFAEAMLMGVQGFSNILAPPGKVYDLLEKCKLKTTPANAWFDGCNADGMKAALLAEVAFNYNGKPQNWVPTGHTGPNAQMNAIRSMLTCLVTHKSPTVFPLYGQADHWATTYAVYGDAALNPFAISRVKFYDPGAPTSKAQLIDVDNPPPDNGDGYDYAGYNYVQGPQDLKVAQLISELWVMEFNPQPADMFPAPAYKGTYLVICEPPEAIKMEQKKPEFSLVEPTRMIGEDEVMNSELASELVFDALDIEGLLTEPEYERVAAIGVANNTHEVSWRLPSGRWAKYFLVPIVDADTGDTLALVHLSGEDGSYARSMLLPSPAPIAYNSEWDAARTAATQLRKGETLSGGMLMWDPRCGDDTCRSPNRPYYEFSATPRYRGDVRRIVVPLF